MVQRVCVEGNLSHSLGDHDEAVDQRENRQDHGCREVRNRGGAGHTQIRSNNQSHHHEGENHLDATVAPAFEPLLLSAAGGDVVEVARRRIHEAPPTAGDHPIPQTHKALGHCSVLVLPPCLLHVVTPV